MEDIGVKIDDWVRHPTPPDSPPPSYSQATGSTHAENSTVGKMSLDFIAPGSCSTRHANTSRSSPGLDCLSEARLIPRINTPPSPISMALSSESNSSHSPIGYSARLASPVWPSYSVSSLRPHPHPHPTHLGSPPSRRLAPRTSNRSLKIHKAQNHRIQKRQTTPPPPYTSSQKFQRGERPGYCPEGRYAIVYLRGVLNYKWSEVLDRFNLLFPPGQVSRCQITGLPNTYPKRDVQGLQCRWYRIREEEGLVPLRNTHSGEGEMTPEGRVLERMVGEGKVSLGFVWLVEDVGELGI